MEIPKYTANKTIAGSDVILYNIGAGGEYPVHGAYRYGEDWVTASWNLEGRYNKSFKTALDLAERVE